MTTTHSEKFEKVRNYYKKRLWTIKQVHNAVGKWITAEEYREITGRDYVV